MTGVQVIVTLQMAHRLHALPGKCQNIHGHTWRVLLGIEGDRDENGVVVDFHELKTWARQYIDGAFDHMTVIHAEDPLFDRFFELPGIGFVAFHPTVENLAEHFGKLMRQKFFEPLRLHQFRCELWEGENNSATWVG